MGFISNLGSCFKEPKYSGSEKAKHVMLISLDGVYEKDFELIKNMPAFSELINNGSYSTELNSIYPTLTYVVHTSIITGNYPDKHGVLHNHQLQPGIPEKEQRWYWYRDDIKGNTVYDRLRSDGMRVASLFWPVSGKANINYNLPEILALEGENQSLKILKAGSPLFLLRQEIINSKYRRGSEQPYLDYFSTKVAVDTIKRKKPNLLMHHLVALDSLRHEFGVNSKEALEGLFVYSDAIKDIVQATKDAGIYEDTIFVITSDHGLVDINNIVYLNNLFYRAGLITKVEDKIVDYKVYCQSCGAGAYIHIKNNDFKLEKHAINILKKAMNEGCYGIKKIYYRDELKKLHADKGIILAIEAMEGYAFKDEITDKDTKLQADTGKKYATHGYSPENKGYKNVFIVSGKGIKKNNNIGSMDMVDIAPTVVSILGINDYACDGNNIIDKIIDKSKS